MDVCLVIKKRPQELGFEQGLGGGGGLEKEPFPEIDGPKNSVLENSDDTCLPLASSRVLSYGGQARSIARPFARRLSVSWRPEAFLIKAGGAMCYSGA